MAKSRKWYERPMRIVALQTSEGSTGKKALKRWQGMGFNVEQLFHIIGDGYYAAYDRKHAPVLKDYVAEAHRRGISIILYHNAHMLPPSMPDRFDEWSFCDADGKPEIGYGTYRLGCVNTSWADWLVDGVVNACECGVDGIFTDGPLTGCACAACRAEFKAQYGSEDLTGVEFHRFGVDVAVRFVRRIYEAIKAVNPEIIFYQNLGISEAGAAKFLPWNDLVGSEGGMLFYRPPARSELWKPSITAKMLEAVAGGKPTVIFAAWDQKPWSLYPHAPAETKLLFASSVASGASVWYGLHSPPSRLKGPSAEAATEMNLFLKKHERWYDDTESAARVALMWSPTSAELYRTSTGESDFYGGGTEGKVQGLGDVGTAFSGSAAMLYRSQIPFDVIFENATESELRRYGCIILSGCPCLSAATLRKIRSYVEGGGRVIAAGDVAFFDEKGRRRKRPGVAEVLGVSFAEGHYSFNTFDYIEREAAGPLMRGVDVDIMPAPLLAYNIAARKAQVLARFHAPMPGRYVELTPKTTPAITLNAYGKGKALYFAGHFGEFYEEYSTKEHKQIVGNAARTFARQRVILDGAPPSVEISHRRKRDGSADLVHLVNYTGGMSRPMSKVVTLRDLTLTVQGVGEVSEIRSLASGRRLRPLEQGRGGLTVRLPALEEYDVIVLSH